MTGWMLVFGSFDANDGVNTLLLGMDLGIVQHVAEEYGGPSASETLVGAVDSSGLVDSVFTIGLMSDSTDGVAALRSALARELNGLATVTLGSLGSACTATITPKIARSVKIPMQPPYDTELVRNFKTVLEVVVRHDPYLESPTETLHAAAGFDLPAVASLAAQTGEEAALMADRFRYHRHRLKRLSSRHWH
jgi:hypothetical protein